VLEHALGEQDVMSLVLREDILDIPKGVCRYRFWNIGMSTFRGAVELVSLKSFLQQVNLSDRHLERHANCTVQLCWQNDENTTEVSQLHICHPGTPCKTKEFATSKVNEIPNPEDGATAWSISSMTPKLGCERYMAISHVWSDGTGAGSNESGHVNMCLIERFSKIAKREDIKCDGIWWDTISLPTDKKKKVMALNKMHKNYQKASCTLVHDLELIEFPWAGDGSPCVALAFSTWFSRGWTALELYMSEKVWVLFGSPGDDSLAPNDRNNYVLKDLDRDILACPNDPFAHPAHKAVSGIIRKLRPMHQCLVCQGKACGIYPPGHGIPPQLHQILSFLRLRYTCWTRDRSIIAALIVGERYGATEWFDSTWPQTRITQEILTKCEELSPYTLLHNQVPICETGKWSWCPPSVFDLCDSQVLYYEPLKVKNGEIHGKWMTYQFKKELEGRLRPYTTHDIMKHRILSAFQNPEEYILLAPLDRVTTHNEASLILAKYKIDEVRYEFIGVVILSRAEIDVIREEKEGKEKGKTGSKKKKGKSSQDIVLT
jgi:hypothetical protein